MDDKQNNLDVVFVQLVMSLHSAAMYQMGKVASPISGKIERDLPMAKNSIDMLEMLERKTKGNLDDEEQKILERFLFELRMNYVDEVKKDKQPKETPGDEKPAETTESTDDSKASDATDSTTDSSEKD